MAISPNYAPPVPADALNARERRLAIRQGEFINPDVTRIANAS